MNLCMYVTILIPGMYGSLEATRQLSGCSLGALFQMGALRELSGSSSQLRVSIVLNYLLYLTKDLAKNSRFSYMDIQKIPLQSSDVGT
jgi:hypothetical protein